MLNKNDPLIQSVQKVMEENNVRREAEKAVNEELGIFNKKSLPFELHKLYDSLLEEVIQEALNEKLTGNQHKIDVNKNNRVDAHDFKLLRAKKEKKPEEHGVEAEREMASKGEKMYEANKENKEKKNAAVEKIGMERIKKTGAFHGQSPKRTGRAALANEEKLDEVIKISVKPHGNYEHSVTVHGPKGKSTHIISGHDVDYSHAAVHDQLSSSALEKSGIPKSDHKKVAKDIHSKIFEQTLKEEMSEYEYHHEHEEFHGHPLDKNLKNHSTEYLKDAHHAHSFVHDTESENGDPDGVAHQAKKAVDRINKELKRRSVSAVSEAVADAVLKKLRAKNMKEEKIEEKRGLWDNIHAKRKRIAAGSGEKMRKPGSEGAPSEKDLKAAQNESAPPGAKYERMVKHIKKGYSKGGLSDKEKSIAYATAWKAKNKAKD